MTKVRTPEPWEVVDLIDRLARAHGALETARDFCPPQVSRAIANALSLIDGAVADIGKLLEGDGE